MIVKTMINNGDGTVITESFKYVSAAAAYLEYPDRPNAAAFKRLIEKDARALAVHIMKNGTDTAFYSPTFSRPTPVKDLTIDPVATATPEPPKMQPTDNAHKLADALAEVLGKGGMDENRVVQLIDEQLKLKTTPRELVVKKLDKTKINVGMTHMSFDKLFTVLSCGLNAMLVGPAGSFKTSACDQVAKALGLTLNGLSVNSQTTKTDLVGFVDANGVYRESGFYKSYSQGGVFGLDEVDAGNANVLTVLNSALSNGAMNFPNGRIEKHKDFKMIATANTYGDGNDRVYVGRNELDAATLDRFTAIVWNIDEKMEIALSGNEKWALTVQRIRLSVGKINPRHIVSPRATFDGAALLAAGMSQNDVLEMKVWKDLPLGEVARVKKEVGL